MKASPDPATVERERNPQAAAHRGSDPEQLARIGGGDPPPLSFPSRDTALLAKVVVEIVVEIVVVLMGRSGSGIADLAERFRCRPIDANGWSGNIVRLDRIEDLILDSRVGDESDDHGASSSRIESATPDRNSCSTTGNSASRAAVGGTPSRRK